MKKTFYSLTKTLRKVQYFANPATANRFQLLIFTSYHLLHTTVCMRPNLSFLKKGLNKYLINLPGSKSSSAVTPTLGNQNIQLLFYYIDLSSLHNQGRNGITFLTDMC